MVDDKRKELLGSMFELLGTEFARCFAPPTLCPEPAIRAHSVQNARALDLLVSDGHVTALSKRLAPDRAPEIAYALIGRNKASTFAGLCSRHDQSIFGPIDTVPFSPTNPEHLFLAAYRAAFRELHASCAAGWMLQMGYQKRVELGFDPGDVPSDAGLLATRQMILAYETFNYKLTFDQAYLQHNYSALEHDVIEIAVPRPTIGASCLFSLDGFPRDDDVARVCLSIIPLTTSRSIAILSYTKADAPVARTALDRILRASGHHQLYELSKRLLNSCENFVIAPEHFKTWSEPKRAAIRDYYIRTLLKDQLGHDDPDLYLF